MKENIRFFVIFAVFLLLVSLVGFSTRAQRGPDKTNKRQPGAPAAPKTNSAGNGEIKEEEADDPDLPRTVRRRLGKAQYLALRSEHVAMLRGWEKGKDFDPMRRVAALRQMEQQIANAPQVAIGSWTEVGPAPIPNGQTQTTVTAVSGRVSAIAIHPTDPNKIYVGTAGGGLYRSLDGGATWTALMDSALSLSIGAVTIDPATNTTVWVGTGEANTGSGNSGGVGIYRIINAETTPTLQGPFSTRVAGCGTTGTGPAFDRTAIAKIVFDPNDNNRMFVGNEIGLSGIGGTSNGIGGSAGFLGLFLSANAQSATPTFSICSGLPSLAVSAVKDIAFEPGSSSNLVFSLLDRSGAGNDGIYRSTNANAATVSPSASLAATRTHTLAGFTDSALAINKIGAIVTVVAGTGTSNGRVIVSTDGGATFPTTLTSANGFCGGQCFYDLAIALDPANSNNIYIGGASQGGGSRIFGRTTDGVNFADSANGLHADSHAIAIAPSNNAIIYTGNDGGIFRSTDSGATWTSINTNGFGATQFMSFSTHPIDREFAIGGTQDNGTNFKQANANWTRADFGDGGYSGIDQNAADTTNVRMYHTYFNVLPGLAGYGTVSSTASASEGNWTFRGCNGVAGNGISCSDTAVLFYAPLTLGPGNPNAVYFGTDRLYRSTDNGANHTVVSQGPLASGVPVSAIGIAPNDDNVRAVGLQNGQLFRTTNGSATLNEVTGTLPATFISRVAIDKNDNNIAYVTLATFRGTAGQNVWKTTNFLSATPTWTASATGIPDVPTNAFAINPTDSTKLYAGTDIGVFRSTDSGATWTAYSTSLPRVPIFDLKFQGDSAMQLLRAGTHGRGIWEISDTAATTCASTALSTGGNWSSPATWGCNRVPTASDNVVIVNGQNITLDVAPTAASITVNSGGTLTISGNRTLSSSLTVAGTLALNGILTTGGNTLSVTNCSASAVTGGSSTAFIAGALTRCVNTGGAFAFPVGTSAFSPVSVTGTTGSTNLTVQANIGRVAGTTPATSINRFWALTSTAAAGAFIGNLSFTFVTPTDTADYTGPMPINRVIRRTSEGIITNFAGSAAGNTVTVNDINSFSDWTLGGDAAAPTLAAVNEYQGYRFDDGNLIRWRSSFETQNLGFNVYRQEGPRRVLATPDLVAGSALKFGGATLTAGNSYSWWDRNGSVDSVYWVEDVDLSGKRALHGPITLTPADANSPLAQTPASALLSQLRPSDNSPGTGHTLRQVTDAAPALPAPGSDAWQQQLNLAGRAAVKLTVRQAGWYRVTGEQLPRNVIAPDADVRFLQLYLNGQEQAITAKSAMGRDTGAFGDNGYIEFYGTGTDLRESDTNTYWLVLGTTPGLRIGAPVRGAPGGGDVEGGSGIPHLTSGISNPKIPNAKYQMPDNQGPNAKPQKSSRQAHASKQDNAPIRGAQTSFAYTVEREDDTIYFAALRNGETEENFFGPVVNATALDQTLPVSKLAAGTVGTLEVAVQGATQTPHNVQVRLNGQTLGTVSYLNQTRGARRLAVPAGLLTEGGNTVTLQTADSGDVSVIEYLRLTYQHRYEADNNRLRFTTGTQTGLKITGFTGNQVRVYDLTNSARISEVAARVTSEAGGYAVTLSGRLSGRTLYAVGEGQTLAPVEIAANAPSGWTLPTRRADFLIVTHSDFRAAVEPLANLRRGQGLETEVINVDDLYDEWHGGPKNVNAVRNFLLWARANWQLAPRYVLLVGDATFDPRNYLGLGANDYLPTGYVDTIYLETSSDESLADTNNDGIGEVAFGRLPARTLAQAQSMVNKVLNYQPAPDNRGALLVSDRPEGYDFVAMSQAIRELLPAQMPATMINRASLTDPQAREQILAGFNAGPALVNYSGHGSTEVWTSFGLLRSSDAAALTNATRLPVVYSMTCLNGYFHDVSTNSLAEALMNTPSGGGAVAVWSSTGLTVATGQTQVNRALVRYIYQDATAPRIGDAVRTAKSATSDIEVRRTWVLFGDPTMLLR